MSKRQVEEEWGLYCYDGPSDIQYTTAGFDPINSPQHYMGNGLEVIDVIESFGLSYKEGNVLKYLLRWQKKGGVEDLKKAQWYLNRLINEVDKK